LPLADISSPARFKIYSTVSGRRFMCDLKDAHCKGYLTRAPHYNSISRYLENPTLTPFLKQLIEISSLPLQTVESDFAVDSSASLLADSFNGRKQVHRSETYGEAQLDQGASDVRRQN